MSFLLYTLKMSVPGHIKLIESKVITEELLTALCLLPLDVKRYQCYTKVHLFHKNIAVKAQFDISHSSTVIFCIVFKVR